MKNSTKKVDVVGIPVSPEGIGNIPALFSKKTANESLIVTFVNPHSCYLDKRHPGWVETLDEFDVVACDGIGMVMAARASGCSNIEREAFDFTSVAVGVLTFAAEKGMSVGLVGGKPGVTERASRDLVVQYPGLQIVACFSGYEQGPEEARRLFTREQTQIVICGMGAPLQDRFLTQLVADGWQGYGFTCGGYLDQTIDGGYSYPEWMNRLNLRFLYRLLKEPRRLWRRYLVEYQVFIGRYIRLQWNRAWSIILGTNRQAG